MSTLNQLPVKIIHLLGIDRTVFFALASKIWGMGAGVITSMLIASYFSAEIQGYYYTFLSVLALQMFAELGLSVVISTYASHEWAKLSLNSQGKVIGDSDAKSRLTSLGRFALRWYVTAGAVVAVGLTSGGFLFFGSTGWNLVSIWGLPWTVLCIVTSINLCCMPVWAILEGCNQVLNINIYRLIQSVATALTSWLTIYLGAELWVAAIVGFVTMLIMIVMVGHRYSKFVIDVMFRQPTGEQLNWRKDILPMQWRISLSWLSGYFTFSLFTPVLFHYHGAHVAGQMGMTWSFIAALTTVASSWVSPKAPVFAILIAKRQYAELDRIFWQLTAIVLVVTSAGALAIWLMIYSLNIFQHPFATRLLSPLATAYLLLAAILVSVSLPASTYLRAHKMEPLLLLSVISGVACGVVIYFAGRYYSAEGMAMGYLCVTAVMIPFVGFIWHRCRNDWHRNPTKSFS